MKTYSVAIDGPAGSGKSTLAKLLAKKLGIAYLDTGAMYRCLGLKALRQGTDLNNEVALRALLDTTTVSVELSGEINELYLDGENVTAQIRAHDVSRMASAISAPRYVREKMAAMQRDIASRLSCVLDGREIGTYVLPNADYKFYLTASPEVRANRRYNELAGKNQHVTYDKVLADLIERDYNDSHREFAPLACPDDAIVIDSSLLTVDDVLAIMLRTIKEKLNG